MTEAGPAPAEPEPEPVPPTPTAGEPGSLGELEHRGSGEVATARRGALTRRSTVLTVALATLAVAGVLTWTLSGDDSPDGKGGSATPSVTVVIGVDAPLSGDLSVFGAGIKNSADLAVRNANQTRHVPGVNFEIKALDDQAQPGKGQENATRLIADDKVLGVVGPLNSSVAAAMLRPFEQANLVNVSPANTNPAPDVRSRLGQGRQVPPVPDLLPYRRHGRGPGTVRRPLPPRRGQEDQALRHRRQQRLRHRPHHRLQERVQQARREHRRRGPRRPPPAATSPPSPPGSGPRERTPCTSAATTPPRRRSRSSSSRRA
ncbi:hypothetical protein GCM10020254_78340 [Streptomyces goshikiensis]